MYRSTRQLHRWAGILAAIFLLVIAFTGFALANKKRFAFLQPPPAQAQPISDASEIVSVEAAVAAAVALGHGDLKSLDDVDRVDYRPGDNIFKVISNKAYREVQVDG
ncbi:MAG TPA: PepSY-associated TM helix domain-containing protein, partial [Fimbriimonas sp.]